MRLDPELWPDFVRFARAHLASRDIDPTYPLLRAHFDAAGLDPEVRLWRVLLYVTWYDLGSAERAWTEYPAPTGRLRRDLRLPTGTERRGFRGNDRAPTFASAVADYARRSAGSLLAWVDSAVGDGGEAGWRRARLAFEAFPYAGSWASYKWADLLAHAVGYPITADDLGVGGGSATAGPIPGMVRLTGLDWRTCASDRGAQRELLAAARNEGVPFLGLDQLETSLCDFNSLLRGRYYVGHDIDAQLHHLRRVESSLLALRPAVFAPEWLGEVGGWTGVRAELKARYVREGAI